MKSEMEAAATFNKRVRDFRDERAGMLNDCPLGVWGRGNWIRGRPPDGRTDDPGSGSMYIDGAVPNARVDGPQQD